MSMEESVHGKSRNLVVFVRAHEQSPSGRTTWILDPADPALDRSLVWSPPVDQYDPITWH